ncbi:MAG: elongation factor P [Pseudomonadota bacterium]
MKTRYIVLLAGFAAALAAAAPLVSHARGASASQASTPSGGMLKTMPQGRYQCALPGDAAGAAYKPVAAESFSIGAASSYRSSDGSGAYILRGDQLTFTRGPKKGERFKRVGTNQLRKMAGSTETKLLCTRLTN